jgi:hypothetical protein
MATAAAGVDQRIRRWSWIGLAAQVVFVVGWLLAGLWQGPRYSVIEHTISDMYADGAPHAAFLIVCVTLGGIGSVLFAWLALRPALRAGNRLATVGAVLLSLSILGLGDLLTPLEREGCRLADPGCTTAAQTANLGGTLDGILSTVGLVLFVVAGFVLAQAMRHVERWRRYVWPTRLVAIVVVVLLVLTVGTSAGGSGGLFERLLAFVAAAGVAALAIGTARTPSSPPAVPLR